MKPRKPVFVKRKVEAPQEMVVSIQLLCSPQINFGEDETILRNPFFVTWIAITHQQEYLILYQVAEMCDNSWIFLHVLLPFLWIAVYDFSGFPFW